MMPLFAGNVDSERMLRSFARFGVTVRFVRRKVFAFLPLSKTQALPCSMLLQLFMRRC